MRIKIIAPVITDRFNRSIEEEANAFALSDAEIDVENIRRGAASIESAYDEALNAPAIVEAAVRAEREGFDAVFVDCFGDPGVDAARERVSIPVVGGFQPAVLTARLLTDRFSIITVLPNGFPVFRALIRKLGMEGCVTSVRWVNIAVLDLSEAAVLGDALAAEAEQAVREDGAEGIVLGCTGMLGLARTLQETLAARGLEVPVVDPTGAAVGCLLTLHRNALSHSKRTYPAPPTKERNTGS
jgi:allantoin racemase